jgi:CheY-like chemotaxis protein
MPRLLVVDDDLVFRKLLSRQLLALGHQVTVLEDGSAAYEHLLRQPGTCDLLISDLLMPGMDGRDLAARLRADPNHRKLPIVLISAANEAKNLADAMRDPHIVFMGKPVDLFGLSATIARLLGRRVSEMVQLTPEQVAQLRRAGPLAPRENP